MSFDEIDKDKVYTLRKDLKTLCCKGVLGAGERLMVSHQHSKNRIYVYDPDTKWGHKVKLSSFRRCVGIV